MTSKLTNRILIVCMLMSIILYGCGKAASEPASTPTLVNTATNTPQPTETLTSTATIIPTETPVPTSTPDIVATQNYESLLAQIEKLAGDGVIPSVEGTYYALDDYSKEFAKIAYFTWGTYDAAKPANFVIQAKVKIANETTENAFKSGCGFVFADDFSQHAVFFALDGNANYRTDGADRGSNYVDATLYEHNPDGLMLTVVLSNKALLFYVNGRKALSGITIYGGPFTIGPAVLSGTSEGYGTRCDFTETALWEMK